MMRGYLRSGLVGLVAGVVGVLLTLLVVHVYIDHAALHEIVKMINDNAARAKAPDAH